MTSPFQDMTPENPAFPRPKDQVRLTDDIFVVRILWGNNPKVTLKIGAFTEVDVRPSDIVEIVGREETVQEKLARYEDAFEVLERSVLSTAAPVIRNQINLVRKGGVLK